MPSAESLNKAWTEGDLKADVLAAGQVAGMIKSVKSVREIIVEMVR
jgi:NAD(P)H-dependent flavin oxidoreductase YrpB (nitropropane dioxygenase family)